MVESKSVRHPRPLHGRSFARRTIGGTRGGEDRRTAMPFRPRRYVVHFISATGFSSPAADVAVCLSRQRQRIHASTGPRVNGSTRRGAMTSRVTPGTAAPRDRVGSRACPSRDSRSLIRSFASMTSTRSASGRDEAGGCGAAQGARRRAARAAGAHVGSEDAQRPHRPSGPRRGRQGRGDQERRRRLNPRGVAVSSFGVPTKEEREHDFLWRIHRAGAARGRVRHLQPLSLRGCARRARARPRAQAALGERYDHINDFEELLAEHGTIVLKFFLHISKKEQEERLLEREENPRTRGSSTRTTGRSASTGTSTPRPTTRPLGAARQAGALVHRAGGREVVPQPRRRRDRGRDDAGIPRRLAEDARAEREGGPRGARRVPEVAGWAEQGVSGQERRR